MLGFRFLSVHFYPRVFSRPNSSVSPFAFPRWLDGGWGRE
jgi:hypothetical protein